MGPEERSTTGEDTQRLPFTVGRSVTIDQAAELLRVSRRTIYNRIRTGQLQTIRTLGGSQRVTIESLSHFGFGRPPAGPTTAPVTQPKPGPV